MNKIISQYLPIFLIICLCVECICGLKVSAQEFSFISDMHFYMDYSCITNKRSDQYKLQQDKNTSTDENGLRIYTYNDEVYYMVALTEYFGTDIGTAYKVKLDNDSEFNIILGDCKGKNDNPRRGKYGDSCTNYDDEDCISILEFIVETHDLPKKVRNWGSVSGIDYFNGNIVSIEKLDRIWTPDN